ncbi:N-acetyltransferase [Iamia sp. SCSIO 61187]|uniref:GNAT family N-acetyltransferase n=1 Tax=Iamia sp. SCSIO 61187 TaxID=2722752 RepID=UPI001C63AC3F|nr:GNAT family N-acetyltransferase [Iamia sp. SCSIO 61187]QYG94087.1 N-acetyltransferase [Iamia sp. SCSIO 61187]
MSIEVTEHEAAGRYEVRVDGEVAGFADRTVRDGVMVLPHTVVDRRFRGRGLAAELVRRALDDARARGLSVAPQCWYVAEYIGRHPEDRDLVPEDQRARYGL